MKSAFVSSVVLFSVSFLLGLGTTGCSTIAKKVVKEPKVSLHTVSVREVGSAGATVVFNVQVENPNPFGVTVDALNYQVEIAGKLLSSGKIEKPAEVAANAATQVEIPVPVKYADVFHSLVGFLQKGTSSYRLKGEAAVGLLTIPFDQAGEFKMRE